MISYFHNHRLLLIAGAASALAYAWLAGNSQYYGDATLWQVYSVTGLCFALSILVLRHYWLNDEPMPIFTMLGFAIVFRVLGFTTFPLLEDDIYRFLWDGRMTVEAGSAYGIAPAEFFLAENLTPRFETILGAINHPGIATIYGPVCQWVFALAYLIAPGEIWPLQLIFGLADLGLICLLLRMAKPHYVLLYAWSPLIIKEFVITAHPDVLGALFLLAAVRLSHRGSASLVGLLMALACGVKIFALLLLPFLLLLQWRGYLVFAVTAIVIAAPFGVTQAWFPAGLAAMGGDWLFNAPIYLLLQAWIPILPIKLVMLGLLAAGCATYLLYLLYHRNNGTKMPVRGDLLFAALFVAAPAVNAWYLVWLLPFAVLYPSFWAWTASATALLAYASGINLEDPALGSYQIPLWVVMIEYGLVVLAALLQPALAERYARLRAQRFRAD